MHRKPPNQPTAPMGTAWSAPRIALLALAGMMLTLPTMPAVYAQDKPADQAKNDDAKGDKAKDDNAKGGDDTLDKAGRVATQPVRDVGIAKTTIAPVLQEAIKNPYATPGNGRCAAINAELVRLNEALGPDFDTDVKANEDKAEQLALAGGAMLVNTLIPFRGLVREISGAAPAERRKASAISAGTARRGYLRGLGQTLKCKVPASPASE